MSKRLIGFGLLLAAVGVVPFALIAKSRSVRSPQPAVHMILDMDKQAKFRPQRESGFFADGRAMRPQIEGTLARQDLLLTSQMPGEARGIELPVDPAAQSLLLVGQHNGQWAKQIPLPVTMEMLKRGQERFVIYCAPCHGQSGYGDGMVARRARELQEVGSPDASSWVPPTTYHNDEIRSRAVGNLFNTISHGVRTMPAYGPQIPVIDRWAIVAYVKALQRSQYAALLDVPEDKRAALR